MYDEVTMQVLHRGQQLQENGLGLRLQVYIEVYVCVSVFLYVCVRQAN
jgi:hypothetical protein